MSLKEITFRERAYPRPIDNFPFFPKKQQQLTMISCNEIMSLYVMKVKYKCEQSLSKEVSLSPPILTTNYLIEQLFMDSM